MANKEVVSFTYAGDANQAVDEMKRIGKAADKEGKAVSRDLGKAFVSVEREAKRAGRTIGDSLRDGFEAAKKGGAAAVTALESISAGALGAGTAFAAMADGIAEQVELTQKLSAQTGFATDTIAGFARVAELTGKELEDIVPIDLPIRLLETAQGTGEAKVAFDALGISATKADGSLRTADDVLPEILDKLSRVENPSTKAALAIQALGTEAEQMLSAFEDSSDLTDAIDEASRFGTDVGPEAAVAARAWRRATANLNTAFADAQQGLFSAFGPTAVNIIERFSLGFTFLSAAAAEMVNVLSGSKSLSQALDDATAEARVFFEVMQDGASEVDTFVGPTLDQLAETFDDVGILAAQMGTSGKESVDAFVQTSKGAIPLLEEMAEIGTESADDLADAFDGASLSIGESLKEAGATAKDVFTALGDFASGMLGQLTSFSEMQLQTQMHLSEETLRNARESGEMTGEQLVALEREQRDLVMRAWRRNKSLQIAAAVTDGIRAGISLIPSFAAIPFGGGVAAAVALAATTTGIAIADIRRERPPEAFPTGGVVGGGGERPRGLMGGDHVMIAAQPREGIASQRAMADPAFVSRLMAANRGERPGEIEVHHKISIDRRGRLRVAASHRLSLGKRTRRG